VLENTKAKSTNDKISSKAVVAQRRCYQDIKTSRTKRSRHQDKTRRKCLLCFACLLGWILLGRMDGSYAWIGSEIQFRIVNRTPQGVESPIYSRQYNTFIFVLHQSIFMRKRTLSHFPIQNHFSTKNSFHF